MIKRNRIEITAFLIVAVVLSYAWLKSCISDKSSMRPESRSGCFKSLSNAENASSASLIEGSFDEPENIVKYIVHVIENGSNSLGFPGGEMEGGYVDSGVAPRIACYVLELSGRKCPYSYPRDAAMYFSSVCAGCHGNDGKGLHGSFPDLTKKELLGIKRFMRAKSSPKK